MSKIIVDRYVYANSEETQFRRMSQLPKHFDEQNRLHNDKFIIRVCPGHSGIDILVAVGKEFDRVSRKDVDIVYVYRKRVY